MDHQADFETSLEDDWDPGAYYLREWKPSWGHWDDNTQLEEGGGPGLMERSSEVDPVGPFDGKQIGHYRPTFFQLKQ